MLTDSRPEVLELATNNARRNDLGDVRVAHLDWAAPEASALAAEGARFSLVVAADCVYAAPGSEAGAALPLAHVIARFLAPDGRALVALDADPKRGAAAVEEVAQFDGAGAPPASAASTPRTAPTACARAPTSRRRAREACLFA